MGNRLPASWGMPIGILVITGIKLLLLAISPVELAPDEAYYWDWSRNLDWAYFSKGSTIALLIAASTSLLGETAFAVRLPTTLCSGLFLWGLWRCLQRCAAPSAPIATLLLFFCSSLFFCTLGLGATTDAPCLAALVWGMYFCLQKAPLRCGLLMGIAITTKYTAVLFAFAPCLAWASAAAYAGNWRNSLQSWLQYGAVLTMCLLPIAYWNLTHANINFQHNAGHLIAHSWSSIRWFSGTVELLLTQLAAIGIILLPVLLKATGRAVAAGNSSPVGSSPDTVLSQRSAYWFGMSGIMVLSVCVLVSIYRRIYPNWPMPAYPFLLLLVASVAVPFADEDRLRKYLHLSWSITGLMLMLAMPVLLGLPLPSVVQQAKPIQKISGWHELGNVIDQHAGDSSFIYASHYEVAAESSFYSQKKLPAICDTLDNRRMNQYDVWRNRWHTLVGTNAIIVVPTPLVQMLRLQRQFANIKLVTTVNAGGKELSLLRGERFKNIP